MILTLEEVKQYARIDAEDDDTLLQGMIIAAEEYLKNATGKEYPETDEDGNKIGYELEKIYLQMLVAYWYERRSPVGDSRTTPANGVVEDFNYMARSILLQLQNK